MTLPAVHFCLKDSHDGQLLQVVSFSITTGHWTRLPNYCDRPETADGNGANAVGAVTCRTPKLQGRFLRKLNLNLGVRDGGMSGWGGAISADRGLDRSRRFHAMLRQRWESYCPFIDRANLLRKPKTLKATSTGF